MSSSSATAADRFLPAPLTAFVGRERELAGLRALLARRDVRLLTVTGPGGVGKTRLAIEAARELADGFAAGVRFVPLAPLGSPDLVLPAIARTLGIGESHPGGILRDLTEQLASTELLLVLDNFEQVLAAGPDLVPLLAACPALTLLVTSRAALHVSGEHEFAVPPLPLPVERGTWTFEQIAASDAVRLFVERAEAVQAGFRLTPANAWDVAEICRRLDGLPLAIELAAARVKVFPPRALLARLERRLPLLTGGPRDAPARLRTMRDAIAWSHDLLDADEQRLFRRLAVFVGGFTLDAAIDVAGDGTLPEAAVVDGISSLVDKSLLLPAASDDAANDDLGEPRFSDARNRPRVCARRAGALRRGRRDSPGPCGLLSGTRPSAPSPSCAAPARSPGSRDSKRSCRTCAPCWTGRWPAATSRPDCASPARSTGSGSSATTSPKGAPGSSGPARPDENRPVPPGRRHSARGCSPGAPASMRCRRSTARKPWSGSRRATTAGAWPSSLTNWAHLAEDLEHDGERSIALLADSLAQFEAIGDAWGVAYSQRCLGWAWTADQPRLRARHLPADAGPGDLSPPG